MLTWRFPLSCPCHPDPLCLPASPAATRTKLSTAARPLVVTGLLILLGLCWLLFFHRLANRSTWSSHEARAAQDAQTILLDNAWGLPHLFDRKVELQKPPLYYWLVAGIAYLRGTPVDAWSVRLPAACAGLGGVLLVCLLGLARRRPIAGFTAAAMLATASHYAWLARTGRIDMVLALLVGVNLVAFYLGQRRRMEQEGRGAWSWFFLAYVAAALAVLLKGPIGLLLPAAVAGAHLLIEGAIPPLRDLSGWWRLIHGLGLWWGVPLVLAISVPWYVWANARTHGDLFWVFIWKHNIERGLGDGALRSHPWWFYGPRFGFDFLPWSLLLPVAAWLAFRRGWWRADPEMRYGATWFLTGIAVLSCAHFKRADYLLPTYAGAALLLGSAAERCHRSAQRPPVLAATFAVLLSGAALGSSLYAALAQPARVSAHEYHELAREIRRRAPAPQLVLFFRTEAHALAFEVGRPIDTLLEWENLDVWAARPQNYHVVMPATYASVWREHLKKGQLEEVLRSPVLAGAYHDDPLVLLRTKPGPAPPAPSGELVCPNSSTGRR
jgi:4-amino-4-deoxy-L-arabinose transferase-like glycosyltransferase